jgi:hypothetical protein
MIFGVRIDEVRKKSPSFKKILRIYN